MEPSDRADTDSTRSLVAIDLNCPWCLNATIEALEADPQVTVLKAHSADGCLEITHAGALEGILRTITSAGRSIEVSANGEAVMAPATARVETCCPHHSTPAVPRVTARQSHGSTGPAPSLEGGAD